MAGYEDLKVGNKVSFNTYIPAIIGSNYSGAEIIAELGYKALGNKGQAVPNIHETALSKLPVGTPSDYRELTYIHILKRDGSEAVLAVNWINPDTVLVNGVSEYTLTITNATPEKYELLRRYASIELGLGFG